MGPDIRAHKSKNFVVFYGKTVKMRQGMHKKPTVGVGHGVYRWMGTITEKN